MSLARLALALLFLAPLSACALSGEPVQGRVLEAGTGKPLEGAIVVVTWRGWVSQLVETRNVCVHVESAVTDAEGRYSVPGWSKASVMWVRELAPQIDPYKAGYARSPEYYRTQSYRQGVELLEAFRGTREERFDYLSGMVGRTNCGGAEDSFKRLYRILIALHREAKEMAVTPQERWRVERMRSLAEETLVDRSKPTRYDERGRLVNVDPNDNFKPEDLQ